MNAVVALAPSTNRRYKDISKIQRMDDGPFNGFHMEHGHQTPWSCTPVVEYFFSRYLGHSENINYHPYGIPIYEKKSSDQCWIIKLKGELAGKRDS